MFMPRRPAPATLLVSMILIALMMAGIGHADARDTAAQPMLETIELQAGMHRIRAEVAQTSAQRERGLMHRESLALNSGMLFVFERPQVQCFWMRNTPLPLSIAFIADDGTIVNIAQMQPNSDDSHCADQPVRFALEMEQGWFARKGLAAGSRLKGKGVFTP